ncbi:MAG: 5'-deoxynucleotidase [Eubacteriales bacterium]|nr:5'-deoxynucleotidase [Eubacteriales bacterium]
MEMYPFHALLGRMKYIARWALMRSGRQESLSEHTADTAILAHALCLIAQRVTGTGEQIRPDTVAAAALYHDAPEILTGDMPTPVKYKNEALRSAYKAVEAESARTMASLLPETLRPVAESYLTGAVLSEEERRLLKAADRLSALIKCMEEVESGNREFAAALEQQKTALQKMHCPEADYFMEHMLPCYTQNLDELTRGRF